MENNKAAQYFASLWIALICILLLARYLLPADHDLDSRVDDGLFPVGFRSAGIGTVTLSLLFIVMFGGALCVFSFLWAVEENEFPRLRLFAYNASWILVVCSISYASREKGAIVMVENPCECLNVSISDGFEFCYLSDSSLSIEDSFESEQLAQLDSVVDWVEFNGYGRERFVPEVEGKYRFVRKGTVLEVGLYGGDSVICHDSDPVLYLRAVDEEGLIDGGNKWMIRGRESLEDSLDGLRTYVGTELSLTNDQQQRVDAASEVVVIGGDSPGEGELAYWVESAQYLYDRRSEREDYNSRMDLMDRYWYVLFIAGICMYGIPYLAASLVSLFGEGVSRKSTKSDPLVKTVADESPGAVYSAVGRRERMAPRETAPSPPPFSEEDPNPPAGAESSTSNPPPAYPDGE